MDFVFSYHLIVASDIERTHCVTVEGICRKLFPSGNAEMQNYRYT